MKNLKADFSHFCTPYSLNVSNYTCINTRTLRYNFHKTIIPLWRSIVMQVRNRLKLHRGIPQMLGIHGSFSTVSN